MTRLEPLVVAALGRSPYDDELITNDDPAQSQGTGTVRTGQQYDDRGRPINLETTQRTRDLIRASNEVLQAAGIIEPNSDFKARDKASKAAREDDIENAYRRRAYGQILLSVGVWGTCGLRRRIQLYEDYSNHPLLALIRSERVVHSIPHMLGAGLPAILLNRALANVAHVYEQIFDMSGSTIRKLIKNGFYYIMFHYKYFAILQQLDLVTSHRLVPTLLFMVPFSSHSPLYMPPLPPAFSFSNSLSFAVSLSRVIAPYILLTAWSRVSIIFMNLIYDPLYDMLPHPSNIRNLSYDLATTIRELRQTILHEERENQSHPQISDPNSVAFTSASSSTDDTSSDLETLGYRRGPAFPTSPETPTSDPRTLRALEGRARSPSPQRQPLSPIQRRDSLATTVDGQDATQTTLISFDVEATDEPVEAMGSYSAELRNANYADAPKPVGKMYNVTAMSLLPAHLAADGLSVLLAAAITWPLEMITVRAIGQSWRRKLGLGSSDMFPILLQKGSRISWMGIGNIVALFATDLLITGVVWGVYMAGITLWDLKTGVANHGQQNKDL